ncbi:MAG TPA: hypothetical protein VK572_08260, partial [Burkholderiales bacterium]|nr:hypothetical protein [Burkholderiales bacterium]
MKLWSRYVMQPLSLRLRRVFRAGSQSRSCSITAACALRVGAFALFLCAAFPVAAQTAAPSKFIQTFLVYYGGGPTLVASDAPKLAKFDLLDIDRFRYNQLTPGTWSA